MTELDDIQSKLDELSRLRKEIAIDAGKLKDKKDLYENLREEIKFDLQVNKLESLKNDRVQVTIAQKLTAKIVDPAKVEDWLVVNDFNLEEYKRLDATMISSLALGRYKDPEFGEVVDGMEIDMDESLRVIDRKEK